MLEELSSPALWQAFYRYKSSRGLLTKREEQALTSYIAEGRYRAVAQRLAEGGNPFGHPTRRSIAKQGTARKRIVYTYAEDENWALKMVAYLLHQYDGLFCDNCYAFRQGTGARNAFLRFARTDLSNQWCFKADISDYFNSLDVDILCRLIQQALGEEDLCALLCELLRDPWVCRAGQLVKEQKGCMAGTPIAPFCANLYLREMDAWFERRGALYARYSDDVVFFGSEREIAIYREAFEGFLEKYRLRVNPEKVGLYAPGEPWSFLGFSSHRGVIDIAPATVKKLLARIRRAARRLYRWRLREGVAAEKALQVMNRKFNRKFYAPQGGRELTWARWYFPILNTDDSLRVIDRALQQYLRYLVTGRHNRANPARAPYDMLKACGYRPLVPAYYAYRREGLEAIYAPHSQDDC